jgi:hypothetical protein
MFARLLGDDDRRWLGLILLTAAFVLSNAAVCGALSAPVPRYQARLIWLIPALALLIGGSMLARWRRHVVAARQTAVNPEAFQPYSEPAT